MEKSFNINSPKSQKIGNKARLSSHKFKSMMTEGGSHIKSGNYPLALEMFLVLLNAQPKNPTVNYYLGYCHHALGNAEQACLCYQVAVKEKPELFQAWLNLANAFMLLEKFGQAKIAFLKAVKLKPNNPHALYGTGMALGAVDDDFQAAEYFFKAYELDSESKEIRINLITALTKSENYKKVLEVIAQIPDFKEDLLLLRHYGIALVGIGDLDNAEQALLAYHNVDPDNQEVLYNIARVYQDKTQYEKSLHYFNLLDDKDSDVKTLSHMGAVLDSLGRFNEAETVLEQALKLNEDDVSILNHLGNALSGGNKIDDAEKIYRKAIEVQSDSAMSYNNLGFALAARGRTQEAIEEYEKAISLKPGYGETYRNLLTVKKIKSNTDPVIGKMIDQIESKSIADRDRIQFGFALGKALDDCGEYDDAFKYYKLANDLVAADRPFNVESFTDHVNKIIEVFTKEFFYDHTGLSGSRSDIPIFVVGMSRSGTTLAEKIISSHSSVYGAGELGKLFEVVKYYETQSGIEYPYALKQPNKGLLVEAASSYLNYVGKYLPNKAVYHVVDKMPYNFAHVGFLALAIPNAKLIHCQRDPIDTCLSNYFQYFPRGLSCLYDLGQLSSYYKQYLRLMAHWRTVLPMSIFDLQYEALIENQEQVSKQVIDHLGLEWQEDCLQSHKSTSSVRTASVWQVRQPIYKKSVKRWKNYEKHLGALIESLESDKE